MPVHSVLGMHLILILFYITRDSLLTTKFFVALVIIVLGGTLLLYAEAAVKEQTAPICTRPNKARLYSFYYSCIRKFKG